MNKVAVAFYLILGLVMCGPFMAVLVFLVLALVLLVPLEMTIGAPRWLYVIVGVLSTIITVLLVIGIAVDRAEKDLVHKAEVKRAQEDLKLTVTHGYIDTAVDTLTTEMDRQFKKVRGDIETRTSDQDQGSSGRWQLLALPGPSATALLTVGWISGRGRHQAPPP